MLSEQRMAFAEEDVAEVRRQTDGLGEDLVPLGIRNWYN